ncbi:MAG: MBL fold metallo-hydrolase [Gammaproteobacteria bacterium]|nr:MBL fold metallo-hydrolase [Gammaproteobacteria bacterium]
MQFASLGSGSKGNGTLIRAGRTTVLLDCGFSAREAERRLERLGVAPGSLDAILVTHEHGDHMSGVARLARRHGLAVWLTPGSFAAHDGPVMPKVRELCPHEPFSVGDLRIEPFPVPHDAREPCQFVFGDGRRRLGILSDAGSITPQMQAKLSGCDALMLECNHDPAMLAAGPYPERLKKRVGGDHGHLNNAQAAGLLAAMDTSRLQHLVLIHLSQVNNTPDLARQAVAEALKCAPGDLAVADQQQGFGWRHLT